MSADTIYDDSESDRDGTDLETDQATSIGGSKRLGNRQDCLFEENELDGDEPPRRKTTIEEQWEKNQVMPRLLPGNPSLTPWSFERIP